MIKFLLIWFTTWAHLAAAVMLIAGGNHAAAWFAVVAAWFAFEATTCKKKA